MSADEERRAEMLRQFESIISGGGLEDLRARTSGLLDLGGRSAGQGDQQGAPELRRPPLAGLRSFRLRVELKHSEPPIWRRLEARSDLTLDVVHKVLQATFAWWDYHLWRFALGGGPYDRGAQQFVCPWDDQDEDPEDDRAILASTVRLDEVMQEPGDVLTYLYDYGDNWELILRLEEVSAAAPDMPSAVAIDGDRAAPPEDCGSRRTVEELAEVLEDPARFDVAEINEALRCPYFLLTEHGFDRRVVDLLDRLTHSPVGEDITRRALALLTDPGPPSDAELRDSFAAFRWFLDRAADAPIPLTAAGYLKPADVEAAAAVVPTMSGWIGKANREIDTTPVLAFRETMQNLALLRKYKGTLRLTRAGIRAQSAPEELWNALADRLARTRDEFATTATLLLLAYAATSADGELPLDQLAVALNHLGWRVNGVDPITANRLYWLPALGVLRNVSDRSADRLGLGHPRISPAAARLARAALRPRGGSHWPPGTGGRPG